MPSSDDPMAHKTKRGSNNQETGNDYTDNDDVDDNAGLSGEIAEECFKCRNKWGGDGKCHEPCLALTMEILFKNILDRFNNLG